MSQIDKFLEETEWVLNRMKADIGKETDEGTFKSNLSKRPKSSKIVFRKLSLGLYA